VTVEEWLGDSLIEKQVCLVKKQIFSKAVLLSEFGVGYLPGDVFDWCPLKNHVKNYCSVHSHKISVEIIPKKNVKSAIASLTVGKYCFQENHQKS
jgi:hypothetical protein